MNCPHNIYIHVPFCLSKCKYCAFFSRACSNPDWEKYADDICGEIKFWATKLGRVCVPTVFFGGGTPSLMPVSVFEKIMRCIDTNFDMDSDCEITLESNPGTLDANKLHDFVANGVNRLSVGVQSLNDDELLFLGRRHNARQARYLLETAQSMDIRVSADFIYGLPGHDVSSIEILCRQINDLNLKHVSMYELTIEKNTPFRNMNLQMPTNETMAQMYTAIGKNLSIPRYEVSNYAAPGNECRHNQNIWAGGAYVGIGRAAAGRVFIDNEWFDEKGNFERFDKISNETRAIEKIMTGLRTTRGVRLTDDVRRQINFDWVAANNDLVEMNEKYLYAKPRGMLVLDNITLELIK